MKRISLISFTKTYILKYIKVYRWTSATSQDGVMGTRFGHLTGATTELDKPYKTMLFRYWTSDGKRQ